MCEFDGTNRNEVQELEQKAHQGIEHRHTMDAGRDEHTARCGHGRCASSSVTTTRSQSVPPAQLYKQLKRSESDRQNPITTSAEIVGNSPTGCTTQRPNTADHLSKAHKRITGRSYGSLLNIVERRRQRDEQYLQDLDENIPINISNATNLSNFMRKSSQERQSPHARVDGYQSETLSGLQRLNASNTESSQIERRSVADNNYRANSSNCSRSSGSSHEAAVCDAPPGHRINDVRISMSQYLKQQHTVALLTREQQELKHLIHILQEQLRQLMAVPSYGAGEEIEKWGHFFCIKILTHLTFSLCAMQRNPSQRKNDG